MAEQEISFEWNEAKARQNLEKHGVSFLTAAGVFSSPILERMDDREDYGEVRWIALGRLETEVYRVVYMWRAENLVMWRAENLVMWRAENLVMWRAENLVRIISAHRASVYEKELYYRETFPK